MSYTHTQHQRALDRLVHDMRGVDIDSVSLATHNRLLLIGRLVAATLSRSDCVYATTRFGRSIRIGGPHGTTLHIQDTDQ